MAEHPVLALLKKPVLRFNFEPIFYNSVNGEFGKMGISMKHEHATFVKHDKLVFIAFLSMKNPKRSFALIWHSGTGLVGFVYNIAYSTHLDIQKKSFWMDQITFNQNIWSVIVNASEENSQILVLGPHSKRKPFIN